MKNIVAVLLLLAVSTVANANDRHLFSPLVSYHADRSMGECEINPGLAYKTFKNNNTFYIFGAFRNSGCNTAAIAFYGWESYENKRFLGIPYGYGIMGGLTTGYDTPVIAAPYIRIGDRDDKVTFKLLTIPHPTKGVFGLGISYKLGK